jgi:hypothetical protein
MDVYCPRCGEPFELYYIQHEITPEERRAFWAGEGCQSCKGKQVKKKPFRAQISAAFRELLGDDVDGIAAEMEDAEVMLGQGFWE